MTQCSLDYCDSDKRPPSLKAEVGHMEAYDIRITTLGTWPKVAQELHKRGWPVHSGETARNWAELGEKLREPDLAWMTPKRVRDQLVGHNQHMLERVVELYENAHTMDEKHLAAKLAVIPHLRGLMSDLAQRVGANAPVALAVAELIPGMPADMREKILAGYEPGNTPLTGADLFKTTAATYAARKGDTNGS